MKIRLPNSLIHKNGTQDIERVASDDMSCSSQDSSSSSRSVRSFLSSRSRSRSKLRRKSKSVREQKSSNANYANETTNGRKPKSPTSKIMKRLQKSLSSSSSPTSKGGHAQQSFDNDNINSIDSVDDEEKENTIPSPDAGGPNDTTIDSTIVAIVERAVAVNFPSPYIRPVPISPEEIHDALQPRTDGNKNPEERPTTTHEIAGKGLDYQNNHTTINVEIVPAIGETADRTMDDVCKSDDDEINCREEKDEGKKDSPLSITNSNSLLPPLDDEGDGDEDEDEDENQKLLLPTIDQTLIGIGAAGSDVSQELKSPPSKPSRRDSTRSIPQPPPLCDMNACVSSPLSRGSGAQSQNSTCSSSLSMVRASVVFDSDDDSNDHIASLTKSTFRPPKEVVTIISTPVTSQFKTPAKRRNQQNSQRHQHTAVLDEEEDNQENRASRDSNTMKQKSGTGHKNSTHDSKRIDEDDERKTAEELAVKLMKDLEVIREENEKYTSKNRRLETKLQILKAQQEEHMVHRGRLIKACLYTAPIFMLCGGIDTFLATILLVWVLVEVEGYLDGGEGNDEDDDDEVGSADANSEKEGASDFTDDDDDDDVFGDDGSSMSL